MRRIQPAAVVAALAVVVLAVPMTTSAQEPFGTEIIVLGGSGAVSDAVLAQLDTCTSESASRIAGTNRYATAAAISAEYFAPGVDVVYVATGENFPDALAGGAAAGVGSGPVLLVQPDDIPGETTAEATRLGPSRIVILGGPGAVSNRVETTLSGIAPVERLSGTNRYATAAAVSADAFEFGADTAYVATGEDFPDALSGGPAAIMEGGPVLLVQPGAVPPSVEAELTRLDPSFIEVLGGPGAVSDAAATALGAHGIVNRLSGPNRYATAVAVSADTFSPGVDAIFIATGENFPDALAGGPVAGITGGPVLLVQPDNIPDATRAEIERLTGETCPGIP